MGVKCAQSTSLINTSGNASSHIKHNESQVIGKDGVNCKLRGSHICTWLYSLNMTTKQEREREREKERHDCALCFENRSSLV